MCTNVNDYMDSFKQVALDVLLYIEQQYTSIGSKQEIVEQIKLIFT